MRIFGEPIINILIWAALVAVFIYEYRKVAEKRRWQEYHRREERYLRSQGMPADYSLCRWKDCQVAFSHGHPTKAQNRYGDVETWQKSL